MRLLILSLCGLLTLVTVPPSEAQTPQGQIFRFEADGFWLNLHHFLYVLGRAEAGTNDIKRRAVVDAPLEQARFLTTVSEPERATWRAAVTAYAQGLSKKDAVFDKEMIGVTGALAALRPADGLDRAKSLDAATRAILESAAPIYRKAWWPQHQKSNHAHMLAMTTLVNQHGAAVLRYITRAYQEPWPADGYPVNISAYTNWAGAYSTDGNLLVVSSTDEGNTGLLGLEIVFHESMHQWDEQMMTKLADAAKRVGGGGIPGGITHSMIFYTAGEAVRSVVPTHTPYAELNSIWRGGSNNSNKPRLDEVWKPYLDGKGTLGDALAGLIIKR